MTAIPCRHALADAKELARRTGAHRHETEQAAVLLMGSKATGTHHPASDTDLVVVPAWDTWPGQAADRSADRTLARFQTGRRKPVQFHPNGTDAAVLESWRSADFHEVTLETGNPSRCCSPAHQPKFPEEYPDDEGHVSLRRMPPGFPAPNPTRPNAVLCADNLEILRRALATIPAHPTAPLDPAGTPLRLSISSAMGRRPGGGYGRWDFPGPDSPKDKNPRSSTYPRCPTPAPRATGSWPRRPPPARSRPQSSCWPPGATVPWKASRWTS